ncbi:MULTISPECIES: hypothetical protein [Wolbachia]|uniref:Uncharacterized protein n=1 Tax=Wolbachia pipientis TaxID=955 RepID=A0A7G5CBI5_WOLPI|nr:MULTISPECIES: hypothetical protein [Wolbachia]MDE5061111.1 hypothetical protein [Wolbachia endosymbiont of Drosophila nikananu]QMV46569.1 hypothetical protein HC356_01345 [Wolbachia pipientis]
MLPNGHSSTIERPVITAKILLNKLYLKIVIALDKIVSFRFNKIFPCSMLLTDSAGSTIPRTFFTKDFSSQLNMNM